ncbi:hypothetical protein SLEP1_g60506, partial [Rubroshorea leprosula]
SSLDPFIDCSVMILVFLFQGSSSASWLSILIILVEIQGQRRQLSPFCSLSGLETGWDKSKQRRPIT